MLGVSRFACCTMYTRAQKWTANWHSTVTIVYMLNMFGNGRRLERIERGWKWNKDHTTDVQFVDAPWKQPPDQLSAGFLCTKSGFQLSVESKFTIAWFCIATACDWPKNLAPLSQPIRSTTKTNRDSLARVFPRLAPCICFEFWLVYWIVCACYDWSEVIALVLVWRHSFEKRSMV